MEGVEAGGSIAEGLLQMRRDCTSYAAKIGPSCAASAARSMGLNMGANWWLTMRNIGTGLPS